MVEKEDEIKEIVDDFEARILHHSMDILECYKDVDQGFRKKKGFKRCNKMNKRNSKGILQDFKEKMNKL